MTNLPVDDKAAAATSGSDIPAAVNQSLNEKPTKKLTEKPGEKPPASVNAKPGRPSGKPHPVTVYQRLKSLQVAIGKIANVQARAGDLVLSSTGYPAGLLAAILRPYAPARAANLSALSSAISDYRTFWRVINTPATIDWALGLVLDNKQQDKWVRLGDYIQAVSGILYQVLEDVAYLASKGILTLSQDRQNDLWVISCVFWAVHVIVELIKAAYFRAQGRPVDKLSLAVNLAWAPLTVHWSTYTGLLSPGWVGLLGSLATVPSLVSLLNS